MLEWRSNPSTISLTLWKDGLNLLHMTNTTDKGETVNTLAADEAKAARPDRVGDFLTARQMALKPHRLSKDGMSATTKAGTWGWSSHFNVWACVGVRS